jgi:uncharacterized membrane protein YgcG
MSFRPGNPCSRVTAMICAGLLATGDLPMRAQQQAAQQPAAQQPADQPPPAPKKTPDELDSLVAPIALYPDPLLAQVLAASTYPLDIVEAQQWLQANANLKGEELTNAAAKQDWDPSIQALVAFPDALKRLTENIKWTTDLGNAFLDQQSDVMDACQRMRKKAKDSGKLESSKEQNVEIKTVENKTVIEVQPANPQVIYVPTYNPTVVYGPPVYPYPPVYYPPPPSTGAIIATAAISFGVGVAMGAFWGGCCGGYGWGWGCGWGGHNTVIVNNNFYNRYGYRNVNINRNVNVGNVNIGNRVNAGNTWQHNPRHRGAVPYASRDTAQRFGGTARGPDGRVQHFDNRGRDAGLNRGSLDRGGNLAGNRAGTGAGQLSASRDRTGAASSHVGSRSFENRDRSREGGFGGIEGRDRAQAASNRGFSSTRESHSFGGGSRGGGGFSGGGGRRAGGGGRRR